MKPNFALNLTHEAIGLLHRTARGWLTIGEAALDSADLTEALGYLRASALGLAPQGMTTKLVIPNSQILYTEVEAPSPDPARRLAQVRAALDGLTPYAVDDLVFDVQGTGPRVQVAVVARETLVEAESFAVQHRMNPLSCVAIPPEGVFAGEPFFGPTEHAASVLAPGDSVERDAEPVSIVTRDDGAARSGTPEGQTRAARRQRAAAAAAAAAAEAEAEVQAARARALAPAAPVAAMPEPAEAPLTPQEPPPIAAPDGTTPTRAEPPLVEMIETPVGNTLPEPSHPEPAHQELQPLQPEVLEAAPLEPAPSEPAIPEPARPDPAMPEVALALPAAQTVAPVQPGPEDAVMPAPPVIAVVSPPALPDRAPVSVVAGLGRAASPPRGTDEAPPLPPAFSSRRRDAKGAAATAAQDDPVAPRDARPTPPLTRADPIVEPEVKPVPRREAPPLTVVASVPGLAGIKAAAGSTVTARGLPPLVEGPPPMRSTPRPTLVSPPATPLAPATKPPARTRAPAPRGTLSAPAPRGRPRYLGLILTGLLLLFLVAVAAWSSLYLSRIDEEVPPGTQVAAAPPALPEAPAPVELTTDVQPGDVQPGDAATPPVEQDPEYLADLAAIGAAPEGASTADALPGDALPDQTALLPDPEDPGPAADLPPALEVPTAALPALPEPAAPAEIPVPAPQNATAGLASGGPLTAATAQPDEIFLSTTDAPPPAFDPVALPPPLSAAEAPPAEAAPPPPAGTLYTFDEQGRILASDSGVVMPGGFWMIEARPPVLPPARPETATTPPTAATAPQPAPDPPTAPDATAAGPVEAAPAADATVPTDPAIVAARPRSRPASLVTPAPATPDAQVDDGAALTPPVDPQFATLRPRARAGSTVALANAARLDSGGASLVQTASAAAAATPPDPDAVMLLSPRPAPRPVALSRAVDAAVAEAALPFDPEPVPAPPADKTAAVAPDAVAPPEADAEPEVASAAPRIPTRANVAKQATLANAINLSKVNLIGIFGTPSDRHAMVRTGQGRMMKVKVGDRVDGGTVAAITASELRYQKGGKLVTLTMPRG